MRATGVGDSRHVSGPGNVYQQPGPRCLNLVGPFLAWLRQRSDGRRSSFASVSLVEVEAMGAECRCPRETLVIALSFSSEFLWFLQNGGLVDSYACLRSQLQKLSYPLQGKPQKSYPLPFLSEFSQMGGMQVRSGELPRPKHGMEKLAGSYWQPTGFSNLGRFQISSGV